MRRESTPSKPRQSKPHESKPRSAKPPERQRPSESEDNFERWQPPHEDLISSDEETFERWQPPLVFNRGCALMSEAFFQGSFKGSAKDKVYQYSRSSSSFVITVIIIIIIILISKEAFPMKQAKGSQL
jgi:hypothetical protein